MESRSISLDNKIFYCRGLRMSGATPRLPCMTSTCAQGFHFTFSFNDIVCNGLNRIWRNWPWPTSLPYSPGGDKKKHNNSVRMLGVLVEIRSPLHQVQIISVKGRCEFQIHVMKAYRKSWGVATLIPYLASVWKWLTWRSGRFSNRQESRYAPSVGYGGPQSLCGRFGRSGKYLDV